MLLVALIVAACAAPVPTPAPTAEPTPAPTVAEPSATIDPQLVAALTPVLTVLDALDTAQKAREAAGDELYLQTVSAFWQEGAERVTELQLADLDLQLALVEAYSDLGTALLSEDADTVSAAIDRLLELRTSLRDLRGF